jgi:hypothetical protein
VGDPQASAQGVECADGIGVVVRVQAGSEATPRTARGRIFGPPTRCPLCERSAYDRHTMNCNSAAVSASICRHVSP